MWSSKKTTLVIGAVVGLLILLLTAYVYRCVNSALEAETTLHANCVVLYVLEAYMEENPGSWPGSWDELKKTSIRDEEQRSNYRWPDDIDEFKKRVHIEFGLSLQQVSDMLTREQLKSWEFDNFTAVRPIGPNYGPCEAGLFHFMDVVWEQNTKNRPRREP
jgi:hypothetical protein